MCIKYLFVLMLVFLIFPGTIKAQIVINEVFPNPAGDEGGAEWVELYNLDANPASLSGCILHLHESDNNQRVVFSDDDFVEKFKVVSWDDSWLNNSRDKVRLVCASFHDETAYGVANGAIVTSPKEDLSIGKSPDGTGEFYVLSSVTLGNPNSLPPSSTPAPTYSPSPQPTSSPTPTLIPTPTFIPTKISTPTIEPVQQGEEISQILGTDEKKDDNISVETQLSDSEESKKPLPLAAGLFILAGLGLIGFPVINYFRLRKGYNSKNG